MADQGFKLRPTQCKSTQQVQSALGHSAGATSGRAQHWEGEGLGLRGEMSTSMEETQRQQPRQTSALGFQTHHRSSTGCKGLAEGGTGVGLPGERWNAGPDEER